MSLKVTVCCLCGPDLRDDTASRLLNPLLYTSAVLWLYMVQAKQVAVWSNYEMDITAS